MQWVCAFTSTSLSLASLTETAYPPTSLWNFAASLSSRLVPVVVAVAMGIVPPSVSVFSVVTPMLAPSASAPLTVMNLSLNRCTLLASVPFWLSLMTAVPETFNVPYVPRVICTPPP